MTKPMTLEELHLVLAVLAIEPVEDGRLEKPGGKPCKYPYCHCYLPWQKCDKARRGYIPRVILKRHK